MKADGIRRAACLVTSAYSSYSGCRQYRENLADAVAAVGGGRAAARPAAALLQPPGLRGADGRRHAGRARRPRRRRPRDAHLLFVTHSIPTAMNDTSGPGRRARTSPSTARRPTEIVGADPRRRPATATRTELVFCSRSGPPHVPWLEPDVNDRLAELAERGVGGVVVVPIGFVSDHMEVIYDLDTEAKATAEKLGIDFARAATAGLDPRFVSMVRDLLVERAAVERGDVPRAVVGRPGAVVGRLPGRLLPQPAWRPPGAVRARLMTAGPGPYDDLLALAVAMAVETAEMAATAAAAGSRSPPPSPARSTSSPRWTRPPSG